MERAFVVGHAHEHGCETELYPMGSALPDGQQQMAATAFLQHRFQGHCPHHLLHNLLNLHYTRHPMCTARPFTDAQCVHGSHARPMLSEQEMRLTAPAKGAVIFLPFGLACRAAADETTIVDGCVDCDLLDDGDTCGSCRRQWLDGRAVPANASTQVGESNHASLAAWRAGINLPGDNLGEDFEAGEEEGEETWDDQEEQEEWEYGEEEWEKEDGGLVNDYGHGDKEEWEEDEEEEWEEEEGQQQEEDAAQQPAVVDAAGAGMASAPTAAPPANASVATAVAAAVQATLVACDAGNACATRAEPSTDADWRVRALELELEIAKLKRKRTD